MKIQLTDEKFDELMTKGYSLDQVATLKLVDEGFDIMARKDTPKWGILLQSLVRKGLLFETENKLTILGREIIVFIDSKDRRKIVKPKIADDDFSLWWSFYPSTDSFEYRNKRFEGSRGLKVGKDDCRTKFNKILLENEYTKEQLIEALKLEVFQKKEKSFQTGSNKLSFMQNSLTYLNQRTFENFISLINSGVKIEETSKTSSGATDI